MFHRLLNVRVAEHSAFLSALRFHSEARKRKVCSPSHTRVGQKSTKVLPSNEASVFAFKFNCKWLIHLKCEVWE